MASTVTYALVVALTLSFATSVDAETCWGDKLADPDFEQALAGPHDGVVVELDVDSNRYFEPARARGLSDATRAELALEGQASLLEAKRQRLAGSHFSVYRDAGGDRVLVLVSGMNDVCALAALPSVTMIWVNRRLELKPWVSKPAPTVM